jgi:hypothetical protein
MDQSISIPDSLVLRSLPVNVELLPYIKPSLDFGNISSIKKTNQSQSTIKTPAKKKESIEELTNRAIEKVCGGDSKKAIQDLIQQKNSMLSNPDICNNLATMPNTIFDMM